MTTSETTATPPAADLVLPPSQWAELDGPVHWVDFGGPAGAPVLACVHGLGGSLVNWLAFASQLTDQFRVVALDLAGHGRTPARGRGTDIWSNRALLDRWLREVVREPVILVGNSMGGMITILQAAEAPETVRGLVLVDPAVPSPASHRIPRDPRVFANFLLYVLPKGGELFLARRRRRMTPEQMVRETLRLCCVDASRVPQPVVDASVQLVRERNENAKRDEIDKAFLGAARSVVSLLARPARYQAAIKRITQPTLLLFGSADRLVPLAAGEAVARRRPDWTFEVRRNVGHTPQLEDAAWTADVLRRWWTAQAEAQPQT